LGLWIKRVEFGFVEALSIRSDRKTDRSTIGAAD
jgi:hypothetical protein